MRRSRKISSRVAKSVCDRHKWVLWRSEGGPAPAAVINASLVLSQSSHTPSPNHFFPAFGVDASFLSYKIRRERWISQVKVKFEFTVHGGSSIPQGGSSTPQTRCSQPKQMVVLIQTTETSTQLQKKKQLCFLRGQVRTHRILFMLTELQLKTKVERWGWSVCVCVCICVGDLCGHTFSEQPDQQPNRCLWFSWHRELGFKWDCG